MTLYDKIYNAVKQVPYGKVATYGQIAVMCGNIHYARAVGNALHNNPNPNEIPCYRVVNKNGALSNNFAFGGITAQTELLLSEGVEVVAGFVDLKKYRWHTEEK